jgi:site-specific DNA-methyltransferase (adenine-specific)
MWVYGSGFPKSLDVSKAIDKAAGAEREAGPVDPARAGRLVNQGGDYTTGAGWSAGGRKVTIDPPATPEAQQWSGWGTALKPAWEPILVARKPLRGTVAGNVLEWGTGGINVDGCRVGTSKDVPASVSKKAPANCYGTFAESGETVGIGGHDPNLGRWPANFIHDGSEEVGNLLGDAARFFYCAKASKRDRDEGCEGMELKQTVGGGGMNDPNGDDVCGKYGSVKSPARNHHPTVKPTDLMRYLCRLVTPPDGWVLDPFTGSGSTGKAAILEGFRFVGCELSAEYIEIARARIGHAAGQSRQKELALA